MNEPSFSLPSVPPPSGPPPFQPQWQPPTPPPMPPQVPQGHTGTSSSDSGLLSRRLFARMLDGLILSPVGIYAFYRYMFPMFRDYFSEIGAFVDGPGTGQPPEPPMDMFTTLPSGYYALVGGSMFLYQFVSYFLAGASPGKLLLSITVVSEDGDSVRGKPLTALKRAAIEVLGLLPAVGQLVGLLALILVLMKGNRSIYDRAAKTRVVRRV